MFLFNPNATKYGPKKLRILTLAFAEIGFMSQEILLVFYHYSMDFAWIFCLFSAWLKIFTLKMKMKEIFKHAAILHQYFSKGKQRRKSERNESRVNSTFLCAMLTNSQRYFKYFAIVQKKLRLYLHAEH